MKHNHNQEVNNSKIFTSFGLQFNLPLDIKEKKRTTHDVEDKTR